MSTDTKKRKLSSEWGISVRAGLIAAVSVASWNWSLPTWSKDLSESAVRSAVEAILAQRHPTDTPQTWRALGPHAPRVVLSMVQQSHDVYSKLRLTQALGFFDTPEVASHLKQQVQKAEDSVVRQAAVRSLGMSQGERELDSLVSLLKDSSPKMRWAAAEAVRSIATPRAKSILEQYKKEEKVSWIVQKLSGVPLKALAPAPGSKLKATASAPTAEAPATSLPFVWKNGVWKGYWVRRVEGQSKLSSVEVELQLKAKQSIPVVLSGTWRILSQAAGEAAGGVAGREGTFESTQVTGSQWTGRWIVPSRATQIIEAVLTRDSKESSASEFLEIRGVGLQGYRVGVVFLQRAR